MLITTHGKLGLIVLMIILLGVNVGPTLGESLPVLGYQDFGWVYNCDVLPENEDLDENEVVDWHRTNVDYGMTLDVGQGTVSYSSTTETGVSPCYISTNSDEPWVLDPTIDHEHGFTVEARVKINSVDESATTGAFGMFVGDVPPDKRHVVIALEADAVIWGSSGTSERIAQGKDNTDGFHTFRIVQLPSTDGPYLYNFYRDTELIRENVQGNYYRSSPLNRFWFGDGGDKFGGDVVIDHVAFTSGAYAPIPEPTTLVLLLCGAAAVLTRCRPH
jgi:hypothetical protein